MLAFFNSIAEIEIVCNANEPNRDFDCSNPTVVYLSKIQKWKYQNSVSDLFKVNVKDTRTMPVTSQISDLFLAFLFKQVHTCLLG